MGLIYKNDILYSGVGSSPTSAGNGLTIISPNTMQLAYSVGDVIVTATNTNPSANYGGTWVQIDKRFSPSYGSDGITWNTTNTNTTRTFDWIRTDHDIWIRARWANRVAFSDNTLNIGTIDFSLLGIQSGTAGYYQHFAGFCDGVNAALQMYLSWSGSTATLQVLDAVTRAASYPSTTGQDCYAVTIVKFHPSHMADSACDQFFWRRTA